LRELGSALNSWGASEASNGSVALGTTGFFLGGLSDTLASLTNPAGSLWNLGEASYTVAQRDGDVAGVAYGLGSLIGATQITEAVAGEDFLTGQALTGLDRWGAAFKGLLGSGSSVVSNLATQTVDAGVFRTKFSATDVLQAGLFGFGLSTVAASWENGADDGIGPTVLASSIEGLAHGAIDALSPLVSAGTLGYVENQLQS
jgi:hypothetical protein